MEQPQVEEQNVTHEEEILMEEPEQEYFPDDYYPPQIEREKKLLRE